MFSNCEGRTGTTHIGSSHLAHDGLSGADGPLDKLRINFRDPSEFFDPVAYAQLDGTAICARIGLLDHPVNLVLMTHFMRNTAQGCEMRSRFFLGHIESRNPDHPIPPAPCGMRMSRPISPVCPIMRPRKCPI